MSDPQIIRTDAPHEVAMPEGSQVAKSKSREYGDPSIHKVLAESEAHVIERVMTEDRTLLPPPLPVEQRSQAQMNTAETMPVAVPAPLPALLVPVNALTQDREPPISQAGTKLVQMDFPARVILQKIENDKVRTQLDHLEQQMKPGA